MNLCINLETTISLIENSLRSKLCRTRSIAWQPMHSTTLVSCLSIQTNQWCDAAAVASHRLRAINKMVLLSLRVALSILFGEEMTRQWKCLNILICAVCYCEWSNSTEYFIEFKVNWVLYFRVFFFRLRCSVQTNLRKILLKLHLNEACVLVRSDKPPAIVSRIYRIVGACSPIHN